MLIKFFGFQSGSLFKGGRLLTFWGFRWALVRGGRLFKGGRLIG